VANGDEIQWNRLVCMQQTNNLFEVCFVYCSFADQLAACTRHVTCYIDSEMSAVVDTTYHHLRQFVEAIDMSAFFDSSLAGSQLTDVSTLDLNKAYLSDSHHQLSGLLCNMFLVISLEMTCKTSQLSICSFSESYGSEIAGPKLMKLCMYILWVSGQNF